MIKTVAWIDGQIWNKVENSEIEQSEKKIY